MIQKMKKLTFLVTDKEYAPFIEQLRQLGVVHVVELQAGATSPDLQAALALDERYKNALKALSFAAASYEKALHDGHPEAAALASELNEPKVQADSTELQTAQALDTASIGLATLELIERLATDETATRHDIDAVMKAIAQLQPFGEFSWKEVHELERDAHCRIDFFRCSSKSFRTDWQRDYFAQFVSEENKKTYFITFAFDGQMPDIAAEHLDLPEHKLSYYREEEQQLKKKLTAIHRQQAHVALEKRVDIEQAKLANEDAISLARVQLSHEDIADGVVRLMEGWTLAEKADEVCAALEAEGVYYEIADPAETDKVPIEIRNNSYSSLFEPILKMYSLPNYHDIDPTIFFAPFFMLFFGLCMGDAGYGLLIFLVSLFITLKKPDLAAYGKLGMWLGGCTMVCGLLMGSVFGIDLAKQEWAFLAPVRHYFISDSGMGPIFGYSPMMVFSVIIGLVQVLLGMVLAGAKAVKNHGWRYGLGKFAWAVAIPLAVVLVAGVGMPSWAYYAITALIGVAALIIMFYNNPDKNLFVNFGGGVWSVYGMATGLLGDLLSYIRLFALGLTGGVLGGVFNQLAFDLTASLPGFVRWLPVLLILLFGHGINFGLCMISSFVHPMRLTFVEFFKNADYEGGGKPYTPFRRKAA